MQVTFRNIEAHSHMWLTFSALVELDHVPGVSVLRLELDVDHDFESVSVNANQLLAGSTLEHEIKEIFASFDDQIIGKCSSLVLEMPNELTNELIALAN